MFGIRISDEAAKDWAPSEIATAGPSRRESTADVEILASCPNRIVFGTVDMGQVAQMRWVRGKDDAADGRGRPRA